MGRQPTVSLARLGGDVGVGRREGRCAPRRGRGGGSTRRRGDDTGGGRPVVISGSGSSGIGVVDTSNPSGSSSQSTPSPAVASSSVLLQAPMRAGRDAASTRLLRTVMSASPAGPRSASSPVEAAPLPWPWRPGRAGWRGEAGDRRCAAAGRRFDGGGRRPRGGVPGLEDLAPDGLDGDGQWQREARESATERGQERCRRRARGCGGGGVSGERGDVAVGHAGEGGGEEEGERRGADGHVAAQVPPLAASEATRSVETVSPRW